jgi:hypothetical protein
MNSHTKKSCPSAVKISFCDLGCAPKSVITQNSSTYLARRLATAGLKLAAVMMTRTRIIRRCTRENLLLSTVHQQIYSSPAGATSRRRGNDLGITIKFLRKTTSGTAGIGLQVDRNLMLHLPRLAVLVSIEAGRPGAWFPGPLGPYQALFSAI